MRRRKNHLIISQVQSSLIFEMKPDRVLFDLADLLTVTVTRFVLGLANSCFK